MTRTELYNQITPCGSMSYVNMVYLIQNTTFIDPSFKQVLVGRLQQNGSLSREDWILFAKQVSFIPASPINSDTVSGWFANKCSLTRVELKTFLNYVTFTDGSVPTYLLSETNDFIMMEN